MKYDIKSRRDNSVIFTAEIEENEATPVSVQLDLAVKAAWNEHQQGVRS
jgi:hypothetical protein